MTGSSSTYRLVHDDVVFHYYESSIRRSSNVPVF
jgi:hypothetical protein